MYLSAFVVAMSTWGAISSVRPFTFDLYQSTEGGATKDKAKQRKQQNTHMHRE